MAFPDTFIAFIHVYLWPNCERYQGMKERKGEIMEARHLVGCFFRVKFFDYTKQNSRLSNTVLFKGGKSSSWI